MREGFFWDPGNVDPDNVNPGNVDPGNVDPGNVDPGNVLQWMEAYFRSAPTWNQLRKGADLAMLLVIIL